MQSKNFVFSLLIFIFMLISGALLLLDLSTSYIFKDSKRMPDIRKVNKEYRLNYINDYLSHKIDQNKFYILIVGDSQFYGYHQDEDDIFSNYLIPYTDSTILNLAFNDARPDDVIKLLEIVKSHHVKIDAIMYGLNMGLFGKGSGTEIRRLPEHSISTLLPLYNIKVNFDFWIEKMKKQLFHTKYPQNFTAKKSPTNLAKVPKQIDPRYPKLLEKISELSPTALIVSEPRSEIDILRQPHNRSTKEKWAKLYKDKTIQYKLKFIDATEWMDNTCFIDNTHMNAKGHKVFSKKILHKLNELWPSLFKK